MRRTTALAALVAALTFSAPAYATGGHFTVDGGTPAEQAQVQQALDASTFDFNQIPPVQVHIVPGYVDKATPGEVWLSPSMLDFGEASWGTIQHEFGHELDFLVMTDDQRAQAFALLGGTQWYPGPEGYTLPHAQYAAERFASMLSWTFWANSVMNTLSPRYQPVESGADPRAFQKLLASWGMASAPAPLCHRVLVKRAYRDKHHHFHKAVYKTVCTS